MTARKDQCRLWMKYRKIKESSISSKNVQLCNIVQLVWLAKFLGVDSPCSCPVCPVRRMV